jgi:hypothetical protein
MIAGQFRWSHRCFHPTGATRYWDPRFSKTQRVNDDGMNVFDLCV